MSISWSVTVSNTTGAMALVCPAAKTKNFTYMRAATLKSHRFMQDCTDVCPSGHIRGVKVQSYLQEDPNTLPVDGVVVALWW